MFRIYQHEYTEILCPFSFLSSRRDHFFTPIVWGVRVFSHNSQKKAIPDEVRSDTNGAIETVSIDTFVY